MATGTRYSLEAHADCFLGASNNRCALAIVMVVCSPPPRCIGARNVHISSPSLTRSLLRYYQPTSSTPPLNQSLEIIPLQRDLLLTNAGSARDANSTLDRLEDMAQDHVDPFYEKIGYVS